MKRQKESDRLKSNEKTKKLAERIRDRGDRKEDTFVGHEEIKTPLRIDTKRRQLENNEKNTTPGVAPST